MSGEPTCPTSFALSPVSHGPGSQCCEQSHEIIEYLGKVLVCHLRTRSRCPALGHEASPAWGAMISHWPKKSQRMVTPCAANVWRRLLDMWVGSCLREVATIEFMTRHRAPLRELLKTAISRSAVSLQLRQLRMRGTHDCQHGGVTSSRSHTSLRRHLN